MNMEGAEILTTIAQLGLGTAGFSGIVVAFKRQPARLSDFEAFRVVLLFANSLAAIFLSLIPFALHYLGCDSTTVWRTASALCACFEVIFLLSRIKPTRRFLREQRGLFSIPQLAFVTFGHVVNCFVQFGNVFGFLGREPLAIFLFGLLWLLFHAVFQFGRILFVQPVNRETPSDRPDNP